MARPEKKQEEKRNKRVDIKLTISEQKNLIGKAKENGLSISDYVRLTVLNSAPVQKQTSPDRIALISGLGQLGKIGSNLKIAHELHRERITRQKNLVSEDRIAIALDDLKKISDHLLNILNGSHKGAD